MARDWEGILSAWAKAPSKTEIEKCEHAEGMIRKAIGSSEALSGHSTRVFAQGSYRNRTNVRMDSDVDVCVCCTDVVFVDYMDGITDSDTGLSDAVYSYVQFKKHVESALRDYFGAGGVSRGNKAFDVHANTYRVDADVVPAFEHRRYQKGSDGRIQSWIGTELRPDSGGRIINWPEQNYQNGVTKNSQTGQRFKGLVRVMKRLRNEMAEAGIAAAKPIPSYLLECLVWNVPNDGFETGSYLADLRWNIAHLWNETKTESSCEDWGEINELKYLFGPSQPWTREQARAFLDAAWEYVGFE